MESILTDLSASAYQYLGFGILFVVIAMLDLPEIKRTGICSALRNFWIELKDNPSYNKWKFFSFICLWFCHEL